MPAFDAADQLLLFVNRLGGTEAGADGATFAGSGYSLVLRTVHIQGKPAHLRVLGAWAIIAAPSVAGVVAK